MAWRGRNVLEWYVVVATILILAFIVVRELRRSRWTPPPDRHWEIEGP